MRLFWDEVCAAIMSECESFESWVIISIQVEVFLHLSRHGDDLKSIFVIGVVFVPSIIEIS